MDYKIELIILPVSDVDRAKAFYADQVGFVVDHDHRVNENVRFVQLTPPGSVHGLQIVIDDADAAHAELSARGVPVSEVQDLAWGRFVYFADPDGNEWALQQLPPRS